jgi:hypothetical protein
MAKSVRGLISSADISTAAAATFADEDGTAVTIGADDRFVMTAMAVSYNVGTGDGTIQVFADADDDNVSDTGEAMYEGSFTAGTAVNASVSGVRVPCQWGATPHALGGAAGVARIMLYGHIESR